MTSRRKRRQQDGFMKKVSSLFNLDTVSKNSKVLKEIFFIKTRFFPTPHGGFSFEMCFKPRNTSGACYTGWRTEIFFAPPRGAKLWFSFPSFQIGSSAHPASHSVIAFDSFHRVNGDRSVKVITYFSIMPKLRMRRTVPPFILTPLWRTKGQLCLDRDK